MKKFTIKTLGCKVNQYDTQAVREQLQQAGWAEQKEEGGADLCVINTCTVTENSDAKAKYYIRHARRKNPAAKIVLTGCFTPTMRAVLGVDAFVSNLEKEQFLEKAGLLPEGEHFDILGAAFSISQFEGRTRAYVKIQDGCDAFCSFCIIPFVRGRSRSRPLKQIIAEVQALVSNGYQEIVLTGVHLGSYGLKKGDPHSLEEVIAAVDQVEGLRRLRLSSIEPMGLTPALIESLSHLEKLCPHFHLPLQSGSDDVLEKMRRHYDIAGFLKHVELIYKKFHRPSISTDIIVGFPGETERDFEATMEVTRHVGFSKTHIFPYSRRTGTLASREADLPMEIVTDRIERVTHLCDKLALQHKKQFLGSTAEVLVEEVHANGLVEGFTENYLRVEFPGSPEMKNHLVPVVLENGNATHFQGTYVDALSQSAV